MGWLKGQIVENRLKPRIAGIDFSLVEAVLFPSASSLEGQTIKFLGGTTMGYHHATYGGIRIINSAMSSGDSSRALSITATPTIATAGIRQGGLFIDMTRETAMTASDGNFDIALKVQARMRAAGVGYARIRGMEITTDLRDSGSGAHSMDTIYATVKTRSGTTVTNGGELIAGKFVTDHGAAGTPNVTCLMAQDVSQATSSSITFYGLRICTAAYTITRDYAIFIDSSGGSWTNGISFNGTITNVFDFENTNGTNGAGYNASFTTPSSFAVPDGYIKVDIGGNTQYIYTYTTIPSA